MREQLEKARQKVLKAASLTLDAQRILTPLGGQQTVQEASTVLLRAAAELAQIRDQVTSGPVATSGGGEAVGPRAVTTSEREVE